jgi:DNA polymerase-1
LKDALVVDIECTDTDPRNGELLCVAWANGLIKGHGLTAEYIAPDLADPNQPLVSHSKFDPRWLKLAGHEVNGPYFDTMVMAHLLNENQELGLDSLVLYYCGTKMDKRLSRASGQVMFRRNDGTRVPIAEAPRHQLMDYCQRDAEATYHLYQVLREEIEAKAWGPHWLEEQVPFTETLLEMEVAGMPLDVEASEELRRELKSSSAKIGANIQEKLGYSFNIDSGDQIANVLFKKAWHQPGRIIIRGKEQRDTFKEGDFSVLPRGFQVEKLGRDYVHGYYVRPGLGLKSYKKAPAGDRPSTSTSALHPHGAHPVVKDLLAYRKQTKIIGTYLDAFPRYTHDGRLYGRFNQTGTVTGRLSSQEPNLQNIPARGELGQKVRSLFKGNLIIGDQSQLENRLAGHFSQDPVILDTYRTGKDLYVVTGQGIFGVKELTPQQRFTCKTLVLAMSYGAETEKIAETLTLAGYPTSEATAAGYIAETRRLYHVFYSWKNFVIADAKHKGYVKTIGGRMRRLTGSFGDAKWKARSKGERQAVNSLIQGSAADILRRIMVNYPYFVDNTELTLLAQVHDELIWELYWDIGKFPQQEQEMLSALRECGEEGHGFDLTVPLVFLPKLCTSWAEK